MPRHRTHNQRGYDDDDPVDLSLLAATSRSWQRASSAAANRFHREDANSNANGTNSKRTTEHTQRRRGRGDASNDAEGIPMLMEEEILSGVRIIESSRNSKRGGASATQNSSDNHVSQITVGSSQGSHHQQTSETSRALGNLQNLVGAAEPVHLLSSDIDYSVTVAPAEVNRVSETTATDEPTAVVAEPLDTSRLRISIQNDIRNNATRAEELDRDMEMKRLEQQREAELQKKRRFRRRVIVLVIFFLVVIVIVLVVVLLAAGNSSNKSSMPTVPSSSPTLAPSLARRTTKPVAPPQYLPTDLNQNDAQESIFFIIKAGVNHTLMTTYLSRSDLMGYLDPSQTRTIFAPTDASWRTFAASGVSYAYYVNVSNPYWTNHLRFLMQYHILTESYQLSQLFPVFNVPTAAGVSLKVSQSDRQVGDNSATIITADIPAFNAYIHVPNKVLVEDRLSKTILHQVVNTTQTVPELKLRTLTDIIVATKNRDVLESLERNSMTGLTLLAPADDAFTSANSTSNIYNTPGNANWTRLLIENHMIEFNLYSLQVPSLLTTLSGFSLWLVNDDKKDTLWNGARVRKWGYAYNGVVAVIDQILFPPNVKDLLQITSNVTENYQFDSFLNVTEEVAKLGNLLTNDSNYLTILAPLEEAFAVNASSYKLVTRWFGVGWLLHQQSLIRHHFTSETIPTKEGQYYVPMLSGYNTSVVVQSNGSLIVSNVSSTFVENGPLRATNGLIYFLKGVLVPEWGNNSVVDILGHHSVLSKLTALIDTYNLTTVLSRTGPITLLAPSNTALEAVNISSLGSLAVRTLLLGHILNGNWYSPTLGSTVTAVTALNNQTWQSNLVGSHVTVGGGLIATPDLLASNGVIHIIDKVLEPS